MPKPDGSHWIQKTAYPAPGFDRDPNDTAHLYKAATNFLDECNLKSNPDAVDQLVRAFLPALKIMCSREHDPNGETWKESGWMPLLHEIMKKTGRLRYRCWRNNRKDNDSPIDMINYLGFLVRAWLDDISEWGDWGEPGVSRENIRIQEARRLEP